MSDTNQYGGYQPTPAEVPGRVKVQAIDRLQRLARTQPDVLRELAAIGGVVIYDEHGRLIEGGAA